MRILSRYLLGEFSKYFLASLTVVAVLVIASQFFEKLDLFISTSANPIDIVKYILLRSPLWILQSLPIITLIGTLFALGKISSRGEITTLKAAGLDLYHTLLVFPVAGFIVSILAFYTFEFIIPDLNRRSDEIYYLRIKKLASTQNTQTRDLFFVGTNNRIYFAREIDLAQNRIFNFNLDEFNPIFNLTRQLQASTVQIEPVPIFNKGSKIHTYRWILNDVTVREFTADYELVKEERFNQLILNLPESGKDFLIQPVKPEEMNFIKLYKHIQSQRRKGLPSRKEEVQWHLKLAYPWANWVVLLFGLPFSLKAGNKVALARNFGICLATTFIYWGILSVGRAYGENYILNPGISAWLANAVFFTISLILILRINR